MKMLHLKELANALGLDANDQEDFLMVSCPFASQTHTGGTDNRPSMSLSVAPTRNSRFHCFGCQEAGRDMHTLVLRLHRDGLVDQSKLIELLELLERADKDLDAMTDLDLESAMDPKVPPSLFRPPPDGFDVRTIAAFRETFGPLGMEAVTYLKQRGITPDTARQFGIRYDVRFGRVVIPVHWRTGEIIGAVGRRCDLKDEDPDDRIEKHYSYWRFPKGSVLLGEHLLEMRTVIACEGPFDVMRVRQAGFNAVGVIGAKFTRDQVAKFVQWGQPVVIFFDNDETGNMASAKLAKALTLHKISVQRAAPPDGRDAASLMPSEVRGLLTPVAFDGTPVDPPAHWL